MPMVEILDGPQEWAGIVYESPEDDHPSEIGLTHPRWRGTPLDSQRREDLNGWDVLVVQGAAGAGVRRPAQAVGQPGAVARLVIRPRIQEVGGGW